MAKKNIVESDSDSSDNDSAKETGSAKKPSPTTPAAAKKPLHKSASKPQQPRPTTSSESGSGSESDSEGPNPKDSPISTQARSKPSDADPAKSVAKKRPSDTDGKASKKSRKKAEAETSEKKSTDTPKKSVFQRVWSEDDEIVILKGIIDFSSKKEADPATEENDYLDFIKKNLSRKDFEKPKLRDKIRKLKNKYENNKIKEEKDGKEMTFSKPHEREVYELSKSVWGNKNVKENGMSLRKAANKRTVVADKEEAAKGDKAVAADVDAETEPANRVKSMGVTVEERVLTIGAEKFENSKGFAGEKEWKSLILEEMHANLRLLEVKTAQARLVVHRLKSEGI